MTYRDRSYRYLLQWLIAGTRGGVNRGRIIIELRAEPKNANQLAIALEVDYRSIRHHLKILEENGLITSIGDQYGKMFFTSIELEENWAIFEEIWKEIGKRLKKGDKE